MLPAKMGSWALRVCGLSLFSLWDTTLAHAVPHTPVILRCFPAVEECLRSSLPEMEATSDALGRCPLKGFKSQTGK